jgi:hypothetical protein
MWSELDSVRWSGCVRLGQQHGQLWDATTGATQSTLEGFQLGQLRRLLAGRQAGRARLGREHGQALGCCYGNGARCARGSFQSGQPWPSRQTMTRSPSITPPRFKQEEGEGQGKRKRVYTETQQVGMSAETFGVFGTCKVDTPRSSIIPLPSYEPLLQFEQVPQLPWIVPSKSLPQYTIASFISSQPQGAC